MDPTTAVGEAAAAAKAKVKAERMLALAEKLGVDASDPAMAFGFVLGCASSTTFRLKQQHIVLHFIPMFPPCIVVWALLEYLGVNYQGTVALTKSALELRYPSFVTMFPSHTIPAIQHGSTVIHETLAIAAYVCKVFPTQAKRKLAGTVHPEDVCGVQDAMKDICRIMQGGGRFMWDLMGFTGRPWSTFLPGYIRCREAVVTFYNHRRRVLKETADAAASAGGSGGADEDDTPFLFGKRPSMADITLAVFLRVLRTGNVLSGFPPKIQAYVARCTREFSLDKLEDGTANGFGSGLQDVVTKRTAELGDIEVPPYTPPRVFTPSGGGANAALAGGDDDGLPSPSSQGVATPAPSSAGAENESGAAPVAVHTDTRASLGAE